MRRFDGALVSGRQARVDLVVPPAADAPARVPRSVLHFAGDLEGGAGFPAAGFEVHGTGFAGGVVFDFHDAVVVDGRGAGDDADDGGGYFFPGV